MDYGNIRAGQSSYLRTPTRVMRNDLEERINDLGEETNKGRRDVNLNANS